VEAPLDLMNQLAAGEIGFLATEGYIPHRKHQLLPVRGSKFWIAVSILVTAADFLVPAACTRAPLKRTVLAAQAGTVLVVYLLQQ